MGRKATLFHRPYFKHSAAWVDSVGLAITLEGRPCNLTFHECAMLAFDPPCPVEAAIDKSFLARYAARADCALSPSHHDVIDEREHYQASHPPIETQPSLRPPPPLRKALPPLPRSATATWCSPTITPSLRAA